MIITNIRRILKAGFLGFKRNSWLSAATILIMTMVLFVLGNLVFIGALGTSVLASLETKIDISMYFLPDAEEDEIFLVKSDIEKNPEVSEVSYISKEEALEIFEERHKDNELIAEALSELDGNPLVASLNIKAVDTANFAGITGFLTSKNYPIVEKINYFENQLVIDRLSSIIATIRLSGIVLALFFAFISVLVAFNTIRLAIYTLRDEIAIMKLVGATSWFIRGPFLFGGVLYGTIAAVITMALFFPMMWFISPELMTYIPNFDPFAYLLSNFWALTGLMLTTGIAIGVFSSGIAMRRYLTA